LPSPSFRFSRLGRDSVCKLLQRTLAGPSTAFVCPTGLCQGNAVRSSSISAAQAVYFDYCCGISLEAAAYRTKCAVYAPTLLTWAAIGGKYKTDFHGFSRNCAAHRGKCADWAICLLRSELSRRLLCLASVSFCSPRYGLPVVQNNELHGAEPATRVEASGNYQYARARAKTTLK
jgi:hypothetical protein